jgi:FdhE protein
MTTQTLEPGQIEAAAGDIPELRLPAARIFADRARRLRQLAEGHSLGDYLRFVAGLAEAQQSLLERMAGVPGPDADLLRRCREYGMPPLAPAGWSRHPIWLAVARDLADALRADAPEAARPALARIAEGDATWLEAQAEALLDGRTDGLDLACAPVLGAALQVYWQHLAHRLQAGEVARPEHPNLCPVCGSHPVASVVRIGGAENGLRYLHCALCGSEWHVVRAKCSNCDNSRDVAYYTLEGAGEAVRAEACPECHSYLKVLHQDKDPDVDPAADDLASLALDLLVAELGYDKSGFNFLMIHAPGEA